MAISIKTFNQLLGNMARKIIADTPVNDVNRGSVLSIILEAAASNDFENNAAILNVLELLNVDAIRNSDLDSRAADFGLTRIPASRATGFVKISDSNITKRSTALYAVKPAPIKGSTTIYVNNAADWSPTGNLYIGRGTSSFEGPIPYTSITNFTTYYAITLGSSLQKDHLLSDVVVDAQGTTDRLISSGTIVKIPANNQNPEIQYTTIRDAVIPAGEDHVDNVDIIAVTTGSIGNAGINSIVSFNSPPFSGATVTNTSALTNGVDVEGDVSLRERIKSYTQSLARGTKAAILNAVEGISDPDENKQVASAILTEPVRVGDPSILYVDDGTGFEPSYSGQSVDVLLNNASGEEQFLQLANYPLPRPQSVNVAAGPYTLIDGMFLTVSVDGEEETIQFVESDFLNISAATAAECIIAINNSSTLFKARFANNTTNILLYPVAHDAETIQVSALKVTDDETLYANSILKFPTNEFSYISLYQNSSRLREKAKSASISTTPFASWNITTSGNIVISVDGTPAQDRTFALSDFVGANSFAALSLNDWVEAFNQKFAGLTAEATPSQTMKITSNKDGSDSSIEILGGSYLNKWFNNIELVAEGQSAQFELNRQTGNLRILTDIVEGDIISAGVEDAKGYAISVDTITGTYNFSSDAAGRPSEIVVVTDTDHCDKVTITTTLGSTITVTDQGSSVMRIMSSTVDMFAATMPADYVYITRKSASWLSNGNCGLYKIVAKGEHTSAGVDSYIEVLNDTITPESATMSDSSDIKAFRTDAYPQIWKASYLSTPASAAITDVVSSFNNDLINVKASIFRSKSIKLTSTTELNGGIAIPVSNGNANAVFTETDEIQKGNPPHVANRVSDSQLISYFKRSGVTVSDVWLDRSVSLDIKGSLSANAVPDSAPYSGTYSETVQSTGVFTSSKVDYDDLVYFTKGNNRNQIRAIKALIAGDNIGTQQSAPRTELDHIAGDEAQVVRSLQFSPDDSVVFILDNDATNKTVDILMSRTGIVNSGSDSMSFLPTTTQISANDYDNEPGIDFSNANVWSTSINKTDFSDYSVWMRARNWYASGGVSGTDGKMLVRSFQYGPNGEKLRFNIIHPARPDEEATTIFQNQISHSLLSYVFGSDSERPVGLTAGDTISVVGPYPDDSTNFPNGVTSTGNFYDYTFSGGTFASVIVGDVLSIRDSSGISNFNKGQFRVAAVSGNTVRVFNPDASVTAPGSQEISTFTTVGDVLGSPTSYTITTVADVGGSLDGTYFIIYDTSGSVAFWFDVDNSGTPEPPHGADRSIKIASVNTGDSAAVVASKIYSYAILDAAFNASAFSNQVSISNKFNGLLSAGSAGTSGFGIVDSFGTNNVSLDGKYFTIYDDNGSVAVWFDVGNNGTLEPFHGASRSIRVNNFNAGDSDSTVAAAIATIVNQDSKFTATSLGNQLVITATFDGDTQDATVGTSGFSVIVTDGSLSTAEPISNPALVHFFPILGTSVADIVAKVNEKDIIKLVAVGSSSLTISKATIEEVYAYGGNSTALGYGHNPSDPNNRDHINLYDGHNWVKTFQNPNPNFTLKTALTLNGVAPSVYAMDTCPNPGIADVGELFKLIPTTVKNVYHHFTQKALSQLPIISNVDISNDGKNIQVKSKQLGSVGAVEVVGGRANSAKLYAIGEAEISTDSTGSYLTLKTQAFPDTFGVGDVVLVENDSGVKRLSRLELNDSMDVTIPSLNAADYNFNPKDINVNSGTTFAITDVSATYSRSAGTVWRWTHGGGGPTFADVNAGDLLLAFGTLTGWDQGNKVGIAGDGRIVGFPIIAVNESSNFIDVVNPHGKAMSSTAIGASSTVQICPTPAIKWNLAHANRITVSSMSRSGSTVTINCSGEHHLNTGDSINIIDSDNLADGIFGPVTVTSATVFTFSSAGSAFSESGSGASIINDSKTPTRYRIEKLGYGNLARLSRYSGESPKFFDCGVAVDDYIVLGGDTFKTNNNGRFRVLAIDNSSIIFKNEQCEDELNTVTPFNNKSLLADWVANSTTVTGLAGTFKYVNVGDWVKKSEDDDTFYVQVISMNAAPASATSITLGSNYRGSTASAAGVSYDQNSDYNTGVFLKSEDDIMFFEGDAAVAGDSLHIQNIINTNWFDPVNSGTYDIVELGVNASTYKPFLRVTNAAAIAETNRLISVNTEAVFVTESLANKFYSIREVYNVAIDALNEERRAYYLSSSDRAYKFSQANKTYISHLGKLGYSTDVTLGIDGYLYYTGLLRKVQRTVDGFEPDPENYPGRRAVGGAIETLPPLPKRITIALNVTTAEGINLGDITNNIKSVIINYVDDLDVGEDVILSEIIAAVMQVKGVAAVTFTTPVPSTERIDVAENEKAVVVPDNIGIA